MKKLRNFHFKPKLPVLRENHKSHNKSEFPDFYEFTLYMNLKFFLEMARKLNDLLTEGKRSDKLNDPLILKLNDHFAETVRSSSERIRSWFCTDMRVPLTVSSTSDSGGAQMV